MSSASPAPSSDGGDGLCAAPGFAAWRAFQGAQRVLAGVLSRELTRETGLSEADYEVLTALAASATGRMRSLELRCTVQWEKSRLSHHVRRMEERGLVSRQVCTVDSRGSDVTLTDEGRVAAALASEVRQRSVARHVISPLGEDRVHHLAEIGQVLGEALGVAFADDLDRRAAVTALAVGDDVG